MNKNNFFLATLLLGGSFLFTACGGNNASQDDDELVVDSSAYQSGGLEVADGGAGKDFAGAVLSIAAPVATAVGADSVKLDFNFEVSNYTLGSQTDDAASRGCANSKDGQHIHFIMDNNAYTALYKPTHSITLPKNSEHYLMCFLSRSYHESLKNKEAAQVLHFKIDEAGKYVKLNDPTEPMLFYSRPKGDYIGADTASILLDYYVWNTTLGADQKVKADISNTTTNKNTTVTLDSWKPMMIKGLGTGKCQVVLTLVDGAGNAVATPMGSATRNFTLSAGEPLQ